MNSSLVKIGDYSVPSHCLKNDDSIMSLTHVCIVGSHGVDRTLTTINHYLPSYWPCCSMRTTKCININPVLRDPKRFSRPSLIWFLIYETFMHDIYGGKTFWCLNVPAGGLTPWGVNSSLPGQNGRHFAADIFICISLNVKVQISIKMCLKFVPIGVQLKIFQHWFR